MKDRLRYFRERLVLLRSWRKSTLPRDVHAPDIGDNSIFLACEMEGGEERIFREYYPTQDWRNVITLSKHSFEGVPCPLMAQSFNGFQIGPLRLLRIPRKAAHAAINHAD